MTRIKTTIRYYLPLVTLAAVALVSIAGKRW